MPRPVIILEFNELSPALMSRFIDQGHLPNFGRLRTLSETYVTDAEEKAPYLEPWIQWVTVHTGVSYQEHKIYDLGDGAKLEYPRVYELLSEAGYRVWICGSMNAGYGPKLNGHILPDPWSTGFKPYPPDYFDRYFEYIRRNVQEHTRDKVPISKSDHLQFFSFMLSHGMSAGTLQAIVGQLASERGGKNRWRRASIMDRLQWDVFEHVWKRERPDFSTFFLNSTAHFQHVFWRNMEPAQFKLKASAAEQAEYQDAILFGYQQMDRIVGKCLSLAATRNAAVVFCSALGQQPCLTYEETGGKTFYRCTEPSTLMNFAGITRPYEFAPVMSEQFRLYMNSAQEAATAAEKLRALEMDGKPVVMARSAGQEVFAGCEIFGQVPATATVKSSTGKQTGFYDLFYHVDNVKSGMHSPDGILWIYRPGSQSSGRESRVSLRRVAPTLLSLFNVPQPEFMALPSLLETVETANVAPAN